MLAVAALFATAVASPTTDRYAPLDVDGKLAGKPPPPPPPMQSWVSFNSSFGSDMVLQQVCMAHTFTHCTCTTHRFGAMPRGWERVRPRACV
jgi:hypothetical protein